MNKIGSHPCLVASASRARFPLVMKCLSGLMIVTLLLPASIRAAEDPETHYLRIFSIIDKADTLTAHGDPSLAKAKYREAQRELLKLKQDNPIWKTKVVEYRLKYVGEKIDALSKPPPGAEGTETGTESNSESASNAAPSGTQVKLLDAGTEPRRPLRLQAKPGDKQSVDMTIKIGMDMEMSGMPAQPMQMPAIKMGMELTIKDVSPDGDITYESSLGNAGVAEDSGVVPQVAEAMKSSFAALEGVAGTCVASSRGLGKKADMKLPSGADPQMRQVMAQMNDSFAAFTTVFPEEAVGPGARWEVKLPIKSQGMTITQTTTYELISIEGDELHFKTSLVQHAANQKIQNPAMPGLKIDLTKMTGSGSGTSTVNLAQIMPSEATMNSKSEMAMAMNMGGQKQAMTMKIDVGLHLETKK